MIPLWRASGTLQLGVDARLVLERVPAEIAEAVVLLRQPQSRASLKSRLPTLDETWIDWLLGQLCRAGLVAAGPASPGEAEVVVVGSGGLATSLVEALTQTGLSGVRRLASSAESWIVPGHALHWSANDRPWPELTILATQTAEPDRTLTDELLRAGRTHLIVRVESDRAIVGPLVVPGATPCVRCHDLMRCGFDPAWPHLLAQLCRLTPEPPAHLLAWAVATAVLQARAWFGHSMMPDACGRVLQVQAADYALTTMDISPHPECGCLGAP